jgi:IMP dehydrogenase
LDSIPLALTFDDVLLRPRFSSIISRRDVDCSAQFTKQITLKAPFVSSNMDTVTEARMAIAVAEFGGIGVTHRFLPIDAQAKQVAKVKRHHSRVIEDPHTVSPNATVGEARQLMEELNIHGLPVIEEDRTLLGILTRRDVELTEAGISVAERMTPLERLLSAPSGVSMEWARQALFDRRLEKLPLVDGQGRLVGLITAKDLARDLALTMATRDEKGRLRVAAAVGVVGDFLERARDLVDAGADALVVDIAHGDSAQMLSAVRQLRECFGALPLVAGNVATGEGTERVIESGVDAVKVGVGPGSMCITRQMAGVGVPQFTALLEAAEVAHKHGVPVIADGGIRNPGDVAKAIGAGASTIMLGSLLAGTDESPGFVIMREGRKMKVARGMASIEAAMDRAIRDDPAVGWGNGQSSESEVTAEGIQAPVPHRGSAKEVMRHLLAGLRSGMSYCDAENIEQMWQKARFVRQTESGIREAGTQGADW